MTVLEHASVCTLDCPDTCSLTVEVEGDRIVKVRGSEALPYTKGIIQQHLAAVVSGDVRHAGFYRASTRTGIHSSQVFTRSA